MTISTEVTRLVVENDKGYSLSIGPDTDGLDLVWVRTTHQGDIDWFGKVSFSMTHEFAREFSKAVLAAADDAKEAEKANK